MLLTIFNVENFNSILNNKLKNLLNHSYSEFEKVLLNELKSSFSKEEDTKA